jgi:hypothetical protein
LSPPIAWSGPGRCSSPSSNRARAFYPIADEAVTAAYSRPTGRNEPAKFEWPGLLRKLDRIDPSYKQ